MLFLLGLAKLAAWGSSAQNPEQEQSPWARQTLQNLVPSALRMVQKAQELMGASGPGLFGGNEVKKSSVRGPAEPQLCADVLGVREREGEGKEDARGKCGPACHCSAWFCAEPALEKPRIESEEIWLWFAKLCLSAQAEGAGRGRAALGGPMDRVALTPCCCTPRE